MGHGVKLLIGLLLTLVVLAVVGDRVGVLVAQRTAESKLASYAQFPDKPTVHIRGVPFLTQAFAGRYDDIELTSHTVRLGDVTGSDLDVHLRGAHIGLGDLIGGDVKQVPVDRVDGTVVVPYAALVSQSNIPNLKLSSEGSQIVATGSVTLPGTSVEVSVTAKGTISVSGSNIKLNVASVTVNGAGVPSVVTDQVAALVADALSLPRLPFQLKTAEVSADPDGALVTATATNVVLRSTTSS
jgi:LmeA-like phospholipid-binding